MRPEKFTPGKKYDWLKVSMVSIICSGVGYEHPLTVPVPVTFKPAKTQAAVGSPKPDLFVTMLDSFSRPQFRDALNGTHNLLKHIAEKIPGATATELKHHHPTGGHTAPNLWAFWAGYRPNFDFMKHAWCGDRCEWMWQALMDVGYTTTMSSFTSNCHHVEYGKYADQNERTAMEKPAPTRSYKRGKGLDDHGLGMWDRLSHLFEFERHLFGYYKENGWRNEYGVAINPYHDAPETNCVGPGITIQEVTLNYTVSRRRLHAEANPNKPIFTSTYTDVTHDTHGGAKAAMSDGLFQQYIIDLAEASDRPFVHIIWGDHGPPFGQSWASDWQALRGIPVVHIVTRGLSQQQINNLEANSHQITSHYDLLQTVIGLTNRSTGGWAGEWINNDGKVAPFPGKDILKTRLPDDRNCAAAGIPSKFCTCESSIRSGGDSSILMSRECWIGTRGGLDDAKSAEQQLSEAIQSTLDTIDTKQLCERIISPDQITLTGGQIPSEGRPFQLQFDIVGTTLQNMSYSVEFKGGSGDDVAFTLVSLSPIHQWGKQSCVAQLQDKGASEVCSCKPARPRLRLAVTCPPCPSCPPCPPILIGAEDTAMEAATAPTNSEQLGRGGGNMIGTSGEGKVESLENQLTALRVRLAKEQHEHAAAMAKQLQVVREAVAKARSDPKQISDANYDTSKTHLVLTVPLKGHLRKGNEPRYENILDPTNYEYSPTYAMAEAYRKKWSTCVPPKPLVLHFFATKFNKMHYSMVEDYSYNICKYRTIAKLEDGKLTLTGCKQGAYGYGLKPDVATTALTLGQAVKLTGEYVFVRCRDNPLHDEVNHFVLPIPQGSRNKEVPHNVGMIAIDSLSKRQFDVMMTDTIETLAALKSGTAFELLNVNVNGYNTLPNHKRMVCNDDCTGKAIFQTYKQAGYVITYIPYSKGERGGWAGFARTARKTRTGGGATRIVVCSVVLWLRNTSNTPILYLRRHLSSSLSPSPSILFARQLQDLVGLRVSRWKAWIPFR
jgi:hypothetical protein